MPLQATSGAASYDAFGGGVAAVPNYIEEVFGTFLYTGNGSTQTITNGIDLSTKGGLVWIKNRASTASINWSHILTDTARGRQYNLFSQLEDAQSSSGSFGITSFNTTGFSTSGGGGSSPSDGTGSNVNFSSATYASWTFRKQPKFFDVVTYTGNGTIGLTVPHNLGSVPACIIIKRTDSTSDWVVYHRSLGATKYLVLNFANAQGTSTNIFNDTEPTSTVFTVGDVGAVNASGGSYVAYIFAHNAGGFGLTGTDNVISCGSYTGNAGTQSITLGYEPQWIMVKKSSGVGNWHMFDIMRGMPSAYANNQDLLANTSAAETGGFRFYPTATGFQLLDEADGEVNASGQTYIYIAIRRGPMKVPTSGTSVFAPVATTGVAGDVNVTTNFPVDLLINHRRNDGAGNNWWNDRLRGPDTLLRSNTNGDEATGYYAGYPKLNQTTVTYPDDPSAGFWNYPSYTYANWFFKRAPSFMDVVCYSGDGSVSGSSTRSIPHNLNAVPQLIISKARNQVDAWRVYSETLGINSIVNLSNTAASSSDTTNWGTPTSTNFLIKSDRNYSGFTYVTYLFSTCAGVSKVGSYTGTGTTLQIDCGFTGGARFVLIRRTSTGGGHWYIWDSARGIVSGNDPYVVINNIDPEVTNTDYIDTYSAGFEISSTAPSEINGSGGTFIFLAIA